MKEQNVRDGVATVTSAGGVLGDGFFQKIAIRTELPHAKEEMADFRVQDAAAGNRKARFRTWKSPQTKKLS
jgi:hypothetical protein